MKIAIFSDTFPPQINGVAHVTAQSALLLAKRGQDVRVVTSSQGSSDYLEKLAQGKYTVHNVASLPFFGYPDLRFSWPLGTTRRHFGSWQPDVIHSHTPFGLGWEALRMGKRFKAPVIGTHHTFFDHYLKHVHLDFSWARAFSWQTTVRYYNHCNLIICPSMAIARELKQNGLTKPVQQLSNPVDTDFFFPASQQKASLVSKKPSLIYVGRLSYEKSLDQVLQAFAAVAKAIPGATLKVVGSGPEQQPLEQIVKAAGLAKSVHFLGALNSKEVAAVLRENDIFITASKTENMPLSVIEAMATGLPIVAVAEKGLTELVTNGKNGILVPADSPAKMAHEIIMLLRNPTQLKEFSSRSRRLALQYSPSRIVGDLEKIYTKVLRQSA